MGNLRHGQMITCPITGERMRLDLKSATPKSFWSYQAPPTPSAPEGFVGDWHSLSPGMRREIARTWSKLEDKP